MLRRSFIFLIAASLIELSAKSWAQQKPLNKAEKDRNRQILNDAYDAIKEHYYDPKFHGLDLKELRSEYAQKVEESDSNGQAFRMIAAFLGKLNDSHTQFIPPERPYSFDDGYRMQIVGDRCFITEVRPGTDAVDKVWVGDQVLRREGFTVNRTDIYPLLYFLKSLSPQPVSNLNLIDPSGRQRQVQVTAKFKKGEDVVNLDVFTALHSAQREESWNHVYRQRETEMGDAMIWRMPEFRSDDPAIERFFGIARTRKTLILDLRGNPGGSEVTLESMVGHLFDHDVKIGDRISRDDKKPVVAKSRHDHAFSGDLIVLVDSNSASAAELLARVVQLEKRGLVLGDRSSGMVMEAGIYPYAQGLASYTFYGFEVTHADLIMKDGKSLEHDGVVPDEIILPTAADLSAGRDPVLARAAEIAHVKLDPMDAGKMFPIEWLPL